METILMVLLGLTALLGTSAVSSCLDPTDADYNCEVLDGGFMNLAFCGITDEDVDSGDLAACYDAAGRENIVQLILRYNNLTSLPADAFQDLPALEFLSLEKNELRSLPEGVFKGLTALQILELDNNNLVAIPDGAFEDLTALFGLWLQYNQLSVLPSGILQGFDALEWLNMESNNFATLEGGVFQDLTALQFLFLGNNDMTTLPEGTFLNLQNLTTLNLTGNFLECLPTIPTEVETVVVEEYGTECGCSLTDGTDVCGAEACTPGPEGYICGEQRADTPSSPTPAPESAPEATAGPDASSEAPSPGTRAIESSDEPTLAPDLGADGLGTSGTTNGARSPMALPRGAFAAAAVAVWAMCFSSRETYV